MIITEDESLHFNHTLCPTKSDSEQKQKNKDRIIVQRLQGVTVNE